MLRFRFPALAVAATLVLAQQPGADKLDPKRFTAAVEAFERQDRQTPPPHGAILFVGSSIFRSWKNVGEQMAPLPVINRAIGGTRTADQLYWMDRLVFPYQPKMIVYYCGSNDINSGRSAEEIFAGFRAFAERVWARQPATRIFYVSINRAPQKRPRWELLDRANALARDYCSRHPKLRFIDVNPALFRADGEPRAELYLPDGLHFKPESYAEFARIVKPVLEQAWSQ
jgi:lysophospholipase L1-like esterase